MDAFYASIELQRRPELKGRAMVVAGSGPRSVITTASYEARQHGIGSAMPLSRALRILPDLVVVPPDFDTYRSTSRRIMAILRKHVERVEVVGLDEAYLDLTGYMAPSSAMQLIRQEIMSETGLTCSVGRGPNKLIAKISSGLDKPAGSVTLSQSEAQERFAQESPGLIPGIGPKTVQKLNRLGIKTIAQLASQPVSELQERFGERIGVYLHRRSRFEDDGAVEPVRDTKSQSCEITFDFDIADREKQIESLNALAMELCRRLQKRELAGKNVAIKVRLNDWTTVTRARTLGSPTNAPEVVSKTAVQLFESYNPTRPVRLLGVRVGAFGATKDLSGDDGDNGGQLTLSI
jgi:DNA polymerase-4